MNAGVKASIRMLLVALIVGVVPPAVATTSEAAPYCGIYWGSLTKARSTPELRGPITNVRAGQHPCFDRVVLDVGDRAPGYSVQYVDTVRSIVSGSAVPLRGGARLLVRVHALLQDPGGTYTGRPPLWGRNGQTNMRELVNVTGYRTLRQVAGAGEVFHLKYPQEDDPRCCEPVVVGPGGSAFGIGVRARLPFRVFTLNDGTSSRLVIDIAHRW